VGWEWERADTLYRDLISIINGHVIFGVACSVDTRAFYDIFKFRSRKAAKAEMYTLCMKTCFTVHAGQVRDLPEEELIAYVLDRQKEFHRRAEDSYYQIIDKHDGARRYRLSERLGFGSRFDYVPLQAADVIVYEARRERERQINNLADKPNGAYRALLGGGRSYIHFWDRKELEALYAHPDALEELIPRKKKGTR
jgi:hypothetical protein